MATQDIQSIIDDLAFLDDWDERYRYIIDLGKTLEPLGPDGYSETNRVHGCASQVWLVSEPQIIDGVEVLHLKGDSDAHIVKGLIALALALFSDQKPDDILKTDAQAWFARIGLKDHLTQQRANGFGSMVERIRQEARRRLELR